MKFVIKFDGTSLGGGYGHQWMVPFRWWKPTHWFAEKRMVQR